MGFETGSEPNGIQHTNLSGAASRIEALMGGEPDEVSEHTLDESSEAPQDGADDESEELEASDDVEDSEAEDAEPGEGEEETELEIPDNLTDLAVALGTDFESLASALRHRVKAAGREQEVTLQELIQGFQFGDDYRQKTTKLSEQRKQLEANEAARQDAFAKAYGQAGQQLQMVESILHQQLGGEELAGLRETDPGEYAARVQTIQGQIAQIQQQGQLLNHQWAQERQRQEQELVAKETELLRQAVPDFGPSHQSAIREVADSYGFTQEERAVIDRSSRLYRVLLDLAQAKERLNQQAQIAEKTKKVKARLKLKAVPKTEAKPRGKGAPSRGSVESRRQQALTKKFKKSGSVRDAAALIESRIR